MANTLKGKPKATNTRRQVVAATRGHWASNAPSTVGKPKKAAAGASTPLKASASTQLAPQVNKAGTGQLRALRQPLVESLGVLTAQLVDQAIELFKAAERDRHLALLTTLGPLFHVDQHLCGQQVRELLLQTQHVA